MGASGIRTVATATVVAGALAVSACGSGQTHVMYIDGPYYASVAELSQAADLVVIGTVGRSTYEMLAPTYEGDDPRSNPLAGTGRTLSPDEIKEASIPITVTKVTVQTVLAGGAKPGDVIDVLKTGGRADGDRYVVEGETPLSQGPEVLLYLRTVGPNRATIIGETQGQLVRGGDGFTSAADGRSELHLSASTVQQMVAEATE